MKVLCVNKFWYRRGGLERVLFDEIALLEGAGHEVAHFSTAHPLNIRSPWSGYFVPSADLGEASELPVGEKARAAMRMFSNPIAAAAFERLMTDFSPDVVHIHGIHRQLSPSILQAAQRGHVPVVQTLHDYHHVCPADVLLRGGETVCEPRLCRALWYGPCLRHRCVRGSLVASALSAAETGFQRWRRVYEHGVRRFISPSKFVADVMRDGGWMLPCDVVPNAVPLADRGLGGAYALFAGRLSREKGVDVFLEASRAAGIPVVIAGEGPLAQTLRSQYPEAQFRGRIDGSAVQQLIAGAFACVVPSTSYENAPMSVLEPMAAGVPVVASRIGGIPEIIEDGVCGILVEPGSIKQFADALTQLRDDHTRAVQLGEAGRKRIAASFSPDQHLAGLMATYERAILS